ncbi:hypothetical protein LCY76_19505 [Fictibacillus sp. KIGAM418]|uniref:Uncharacterized protein n=1 Tax=Fictibacillus marinisediminis TaxID=2878389 RepID=A0A9X1XFN9_9BACL|nr:hypothetical protein [Fictibacillus marinisediminis]MCK6258758.1 hypothetical protein [Fictibacillus marinisediminis]
MNVTFSSCDITLTKPSLSCGTSVTGETRRRKRRGVQRTPREKRAAWNGNHLLPDIRSNSLLDSIIFSVKIREFFKKVKIY